jgi:hypothetical protein
MKKLYTFNELNESLKSGDTIELTKDFNLGDEYESAKALTTGEEYIVKAHTREGYKGWWVISGNYLNKDGSKDRYALSFSPREFTAIKKLVK